MSEQRFQSGDVVRLKSGGPNMTVVDYGQYGYVDEKQYKCKWFVGNKPTEATFLEAELEKTSTGPASAIGSFKLERG
jgi:uncharacterized protein YodC (DUF2158 family)